MKKITLAVLAALLLCGLSQQAVAQDNTPPAISTGRYLSVGPWFSAGASVMAGDVADGYKIKAKTSFTFGALGQIDISYAVGFNLGLTYESRGRFWYRESNEPAENYSLDLSYLTISPLFNFRSFMIGFGIRLPMAGTLVAKGTAISEKNYDLPVSFGTFEYDMQTVIEGKIGANVELLETRGGTLGLSVLAGYDLTRPFKKVPVGVDPGQPDAALHIGLNYLFHATEMK